jgi:hypothetical protein
MLLDIMMRCEIRRRYVTTLHYWGLAMFIFHCAFLLALAGLVGRLQTVTRYVGCFVSQRRDQITVGCTILRRGISKGCSSWERLVNCASRRGWFYTYTVQA